MASLPPSIDVFYRLLSEGYETTIVETGAVDGVYDYTFHPCLSREQLVGTIFRRIKGADDLHVVVRIYPNGAQKDGVFHVLSRYTVAHIQADTLKVDDLCIVGLKSFLEAQMYEVVSRRVPIRRMGYDHVVLLAECGLCGRTAEMTRYFPRGRVPVAEYHNTHQLVCRTCGCSTRLVIDKFRGLCTDLIETAKANPAATRFFVNQPWNPKPPWISREDMFQLLKETENG